MTRTDWRSCKRNEARLIFFSLERLCFFSKEELEELYEWSLFGRLYMVGLMHTDPTWTDRYVETNVLDYKQWYQDRWIKFKKLTKSLKIRE
jgi:hypothetical protein